MESNKNTTIKDEYFRSSMKYIVGVSTMKYILGIEGASSTSSYEDVFEELFQKEDNFQLSGSSKEQLLLKKT